MIKLAIDADVKARMGYLHSMLENVLEFELTSIQIFDFNLAISFIGSKYLEMAKAVWIIEF